MVVYAFTTIDIVLPAVDAAYLIFWVTCLAFPHVSNGTVPPASDHSDHWHSAARMVYNHTQPVGGHPPRIGQHYGARERRESKAGSAANILLSSIAPNAAL